MELVSPYDLYFNPYLVLQHHQVSLRKFIRILGFTGTFNNGNFVFQWWRLLTTFLFFGTLSFNFVFNIIFTYRYCRTLEESSFRGRTADFVMMFFFGAIMTLVCFSYMFYYRDLEFVEVLEKNSYCIFLLSCR